MPELCLARIITQDDLPLLLNWRNHADIRQFMFTQHEITPEEHLKWFERVSQDNSRCLLIVETSDGPIGYVQFNNVCVGGVGEWGFYTRPNAPSGSGKKLGETALQHAFEKLQLHKVCGQAIDTNEASIRFHRKLGFTQEGTLREHQRIDHSYHAVICFGLLKQEWSLRPITKEITDVRH
jgi:UDP-4-amino-4,6-dideoxy-N-acetyl-beta-L-altrosamine N-acetyltransferase